LATVAVAAALKKAAAVIIKAAVAVLTVTVADMVTTINKTDILSFLKSGSLEPDFLFNTLHITQLSHL
jgi:hypothetical protein